MKDMRVIPVFFLFFLFVAPLHAQPGSAADESYLDVYPKVTKLDNGNIAPLLKQYRGDIIVLNIWATWCVPCVKEFPDLLKLREEYMEQGVHLILLSVDDVEDLEPKVYPFLVQKGVEFETYIRTSGDEQKFINGIDESWSGAIPLTMIYDRKGRKDTIVFGSKHYEDFEKMVKPLL
jgi:thiol-disulfide isomerase/thioredoxin